jgi:hypothetical protein
MDKATRVSFNFNTGKLGWIVAKSGGRDIIMLLLFHGASEDKASYSKALSFFQECYADTPLMLEADGSWVFVADQGQSFPPALKEVFGDRFGIEYCAEHMEVMCVPKLPLHDLIILCLQRNIADNFKDIGTDSLKAIMDHFHWAARAPLPASFASKMQQIKELSTDVHSYITIDPHPPETWAVSCKPIADCYDPTNNAGGLILYSDILPV